MGRRKLGNKTEVKVDIASYNYLINGVGGIGKTTTVAEIGQKLFGEDGYMHLTIGKEPVPNHIGGLWSEVADTWDDLEEIIDEIVEYKSDYPKLRMVGIDSTDELYRVCEEKVVEMHNKSVTDVKKRVKSIAGAFGGYQAGNNKAVDLVTNLLFKLNKVGVSLFFIGHSKQKTKEDPVTGVSYEIITSTLDNKYYNAIKDKVNLAGTAYIEREFNDIKTVQDAFTKKDKQVGAVASERRVVAFRDTDGTQIDTKSHFKYISSKVELSSDAIIDELNRAIKAQAEIYSGKLSDKDIENKQKEDRRKLENMVSEKPKKLSEEQKEEIISSLKENMASIDYDKLMEIFSKYSISTLSVDVEDNALIELSKLI